MNNEASPWGRRKFVSSIAVMAGFSILPGLVKATPFKSYKRDWTINEVIDLILKSIPGAPFKNTVDTIKAGNGDQKVTGIVTTMFATDAVIQKTIAAGANFIIAHEPTFYSHTDETSWLQNDEVYQYKRKLLDDHQITVWRFHDYWHSHKPDGILMGVLQALGWEKYYNKEKPQVIQLPATPLKEIAALTKQKLSIDKIKVIGDLTQPCSKIALLPGAAGGRAQMELIRSEKPDLFICGEVNEWETSEYIRDAQAMGLKRSLIVLGHSVSEEAGMQYLVTWLQPQLPDIKIIHVPSNDPFITL